MQKKFVNKSITVCFLVVYIFCVCKTMLDLDEFLGILALILLQRKT
jgi:hypothetical protein